MTMVMINKELSGTISWYNHKLSTGKKQKNVSNYNSHAYSLVRDYGKRVVQYDNLIALFP